MPQHRSLHIIFWILVVLGFVSLLGTSSPVIADLSGSHVTFAPSIEYETGKTSASCYEPGNWYQVLCFNLDTTSPDGQDATDLALQFPADWEVYGRWVGDHYDYSSIEHSCTNGGTMAGATSWTGTPWAGQYWGGDARAQNAGTSCHAVYCFVVYDQTDPGDPPYDDELDALVSWSWDGPTGAYPSSVCSNDGLFPQDGGFPCEEATGIPATVPVCEFVNIPILPETLPHAVAGQYYTQQLSPIPQVIDPGTGETDYWYTRSGGMPDDFWLMSNTGEIEWNNPQVGTYTFTALVEGPGWSEGSREYTIEVDPLLIFDPDTLPAARQNTAYHQPITVSEGTAPYTLSLESGTLPSGMSFTDGAFTGTPTETGTFAGLVIQAIDNNGVTQTHNFSLTVLPEHLFTWTPTTPTSGQTTTFTPIEGFDNYTWYYASLPGGECNVLAWNDYSGIANINFYGEGEHKVCLTLTDYSPTYLTIQDEQWVTVLNSPPDVYSLYTYPYPSFPGQDVEGYAYFSDPDDEANYTCEIDWGDGSSDTGLYRPYGECVFPSHSYSATGSYTLEATVTDGDGATDTYTATHEVVYLYAEPGMYLLASNTHPTTLRLRGYAPTGTTSLQFEIDSPPSHGSLSTPVNKECFVRDHVPDTVVCEAEIVYTPTVATPTYVGDDEFSFVVQDGDGHTSGPGDIYFWVDDNMAPVAYENTVLVLSSEPSEFTIFAFDEDFYSDFYIFDELTFYIDTPPQHGTLTLTNNTTVDYVYDPDWNVTGVDWSQSLTYTPDPGSTASTDSFTFHVNDTHQDSNIATVTLNLYTPITLHVNVNDDVVDLDGCTPTHCSLREAINEALVGDSIDFTLELPNTITLTWEGGGELLINKYIKILGPGADQLTVSAGFSDPNMNPWEGFRVFHIYNDENPVKVSISGLTIRDGRAGEGGGIFVDEEAELTLTDCQIGPNNIVAYAGGGISTDEAVLTMTNCSVVDNHGTGTLGGAGIFVDDSVMTITNSTITGNVTNNFGGGILAYDDTIVTLIHSTVSGNTANQDHAEQSEGGGGGIFNDGAEVRLRNTIVAGNTDLTDPSEHAEWPDVYGVITSLGGNLIGDETGSTGWLAGDMVGTAAAPIDPLLGDLDVYEPGSTPTFPLLEGSPAIDSAACVAGVTADQRGIKRPQGIACDIGAFELENALTYLFIPLILR
jgi:hypothetical protein